MLKKLLTLRLSRGGENIFPFVLAVLIIFFITAFSIHKTQALISDTSLVALDNSYLIDRQPVMGSEDKKNEALVEEDDLLMHSVSVVGAIGQAGDMPFVNLSLSSVKNSDVREFTVLGVNGMLIPRMINVRLNEVVILNFTALDNDYDFVLDGHYLNQFCKQGESSKIALRVVSEGDFYYYCPSCPDIMASAGQLFVRK